MDRHFIEVPWGTGAYICSGCGEASFRLFAYCPKCGTENDVRKELQAEAERPDITQPEEVRAALGRMRGLKVRLWDYCVSHMVLQIRVAHPPADASGNHANALIACGGTFHIAAPTLGWVADFSLEVSEGKYGEYFVLLDETAGVRIECKNLFLYENLPAQYVGSN